MKLDIYYDGECPFCRSFVTLSRLKSMYVVNLHNLRDSPDEVIIFTEQGYNVDDGMIVKFNDETYFGHQAVQIIAALSNKNKVVGRIYYTLFSNKRFVKFLYPLMRLGRNVTLYVLRREKIKTK